MKVRFIDSIGKISKVSWNSLAGTDYPFLRHEFIQALEVSDCVCSTTGWMPWHCLVYQDDTLVALMPMYKKSHSQGEYVFDYEWAHAYRDYGLSYYPKWVAAIPFTPCQGPRLSIKPGLDPAPVVNYLLDCLRTESEAEGVSSWHCLYPPLPEVKWFKTAGLAIREGVQFRWSNQGYRDFQDFLDTFNSKRRKTLRRERRFIREQGIEIQCITGPEITKAQWRAFFLFYQLTYFKRGQVAYLNFAFFQKLAETMPEQLLLMLAVKDNQYVGAAFSLIGGNTLYGRYWGCYKAYYSLHFETCYYQGLEYCINNKLQKFDSGAQGEHKIARGFEPVTTYSAHWIKEPQFAAAISDYTRREAQLMTGYKATLSLPFKKGQ